MFRVGTLIIMNKVNIPESDTELLTECEVETFRRLTFTNPKDSSDAGCSF